MIPDVTNLAGVTLAAAGLLLMLSCMGSRLSSRLGVPLSLIFLCLGILAGQEGLGRIPFDRFDITYLFGTLALVVILFAGGLATPRGILPRALAPAVVLATVGVIGVAGLTALAARWWGLDWKEALLIGAIVSSTDAAAVFAVLQGVHLRGRVGPTIELESGLNDPVAVILTTAATANLIGEREFGWMMAAEVAWQLGAGAFLGVAFGYLGRTLLRLVPLPAPALAPVLTLGLALAAYGVPAAVNASGFLAVYLTGIVLGNGHVPYRLNLTRVHESLAWLAQIVMFLMLGLLVFPSQLPRVALAGLVLALYLALVARPAVVVLCLLPFRYDWRETVCIAWAGLRGAMPIILATVPVLRAPGRGPELQDALNAFDVVFFVVVIGALIPGATVRPLTRWLGLQLPLPPRPFASVDISSDRPLHGTQLRVYVPSHSPMVGRRVAELTLPPGTLLMLIVRGAELIAPRGDTRLEAGDHVFVFSQHAAADALYACFEGTASPAEREASAS